MAACAVAALCGWAAPTVVLADDTLSFDPRRVGITGSDGSGPWDTTTPIWAAGSADGTYPNSAGDLTSVTFGFNGGSGAYTVTLATNVVASEVVVRAAGAGASYTFNGNGNTLTATASGADDGLDVNGGNLTLTNGTFALGQLSSTASTGSVGEVGLSNGGVLTVGPGSVLAASRIFSDGSAGATIRFNGGTFQPLANFNASSTFLAQLSGVTNAYVSAGGLTVDTSQLNGSGPGTNAAILYQDLQHDPAATGTDGGLTKNGPSALYLGFGVSDLFSYNGPTAVNAGVLVLDSTANTAAAGPFPNTRFVVNNGSNLNVGLTNGLAGATGTTPVALNASFLATFDMTSVRLGAVTSAGGELISYGTRNATTGVVTNTGTFAFGSGGELHATAAATPTVPATVLVSNASSSTLTFEAGSDARVENNAELDVYANLTDDANGVGQLTVNGTGNGAVYLLGTANNYSGGTVVNGGTLSTFFLAGTNASTGAATVVPSQITSSKTIAVANGATFVNQGILASVPAVTVAGLVVFASYPGQTAAEVTQVAGLSITGTSTSNQSANGMVEIYPGTATLPRTLLVTGSLTFAGATNAWRGQLNLTTGDLDVQNGNLATVTNQIATGYNTGSFTGNGITSSNAAANPARNTAVGVALNNTGTGTRLFGSGTAAGLFDGTNPAVTDVLVRYTYFGDANLDGVVNGADYARIDAGYLSQKTTSPPTGWYSGDFNYDGTVDAGDYTLIDNAFNTQTAALTPTVAGGGLGAAFGLPTPAGGDPAAFVAPSIDSALNGVDRFSFAGGLTAASTDEVAPVVGTAIPEPVTTAVAGLAATLLAGRRRRI